MKCALALLSLAAVAVARPQYLGQFGHGLGGFGNQFGFGGGATGSSGAQSTQGLSSSPYGGYTGIQSSGVHAQGSAYNGGSSYNGASSIVGQGFGLGGPYQSANNNAYSHQFGNQFGR